MDIANRRYRTVADVKAYATCVASTVGLMMSLVMRTGETHTLARAADLGIAMQLTNIARDVGEDARNGRLYPASGLAGGGRAWTHKTSSTSPVFPPRSATSSGDFCGRLATITGWAVPASPRCRLPAARPSGRRRSFTRVSGQPSRPTDMTAYRCVPTQVSPASWR